MFLKNINYKRLNSNLCNIIKLNIERTKTMNNKILEAEKSLFKYEFMSDITYLNEIIDGIIMLIVIVINAVVGFIQEIRAEDALEALKKLASPHCYIKKNDERIKILSLSIPSPSAIFACAIK